MFGTTHGFGGTWQVDKILCGVEEFLEENYKEVMVLVVRI
jgi:hypothetical protein